MLWLKLSSEPLIFLYTIIFTINYTSLPQLLLEKVCLKESQLNQTECKHPENLAESLQKVSHCPLSVNDEPLAEYFKVPVV